MGGRYSYDGAIGFLLMVAIGKAAFEEMLTGFRNLLQEPWVVLPAW